jgi:hypothetical protein
MTQMTEEIITSVYAGVSLCHAALFLCFAIQGLPD